MNKLILPAFIIITSFLFISCQNSESSKANIEAQNPMKDSAATTPIIEITDYVNCVLTNESPRCIHVTIPPLETGTFAEIFIQDPNFSAYKDHSDNLKMQNVYTQDDLSAIPDNSFFCTLPITWSTNVDLHILHSGGTDASWTGANTYHVIALMIPYTLRIKYIHTNWTNYDQVNTVLKHEPHNFNGAPVPISTETSTVNNETNAGSNVQTGQTFATKDDLYKYLQNTTYRWLSKYWGRGGISSKTYWGDKIKVYVRWSNVKCEGKQISIEFTWSGSEDAERLPGDFVSYSVEGDPFYFAGSEGQEGPK